MTIEVRELLIRTTVGPVGQPPGAAAAPGAPADAQQLQRAIAQARRQILAECQALVAEQLRQLHER